MSAHAVDVQGAMAQAPYVDAQRSTFNDISGGRQINLGPITINQHSEDSEEKAEAQRKLADWLTPLNFRQKQSEVYGKRREGTGDWVLDDERFKEWQAGDKRTLWCSGIPGAGKTVLASYIVNHLTNKCKDSNLAVAYIYCDYKDQSAQTVYGLVASILKHTKTSGQLSMNFTIR
ncbi:hypothetical protein SERLA73DRAFT_178911 [Serpula lacrymans var. lacrymans S7.3]|uniref:Nephrocystin 3-like N-terminal domain-containing protein n=1 Tax=Serpula lacrymans var. lacrymans (strain S7.3) TaxID=936435 RepID=F8PT83_SERL3|nr:hypothetical protein SERLA73DRAFT_178911 [Serpula lacrymans var. lacrymans S7.3]